MSVTKNKLKRDFSQIPNDLITDDTLSHGAFRVMVYLLSKPDGWQVYNNDIKKQLKISRSETISKYWKELESSGWISRTKTSSGAFDYILNEKPITENAEEERKACYGLPVSTNNTELLKNRTLNNTNSLSNTKLISNTKEIFDFWVKIFNKNGNTDFSIERKNKIKARLKKYSIDEIKQAITNCSKNQFNIDNGHTDLMLICRDNSYLEKYRDMKPQGIPQNETIAQANDRLNATASDYANQIRNINFFGDSE